MMRLVLLLHYRCMFVTVWLTRQDGLRKMECLSTPPIVYENPISAGQLGFASAA